MALTTTEPTLEERSARAAALPAQESRARVSEIEVREGEDTLTLVGYASVFETPYDMGWYEETVAEGAFTKTLREKADVRLLLNHEDLPLARTKSGTLRLAEDSVGLRVEADLDVSDPDVARLRPKMKRGDLDQMSFAFRTIRQEWDEDYTARRLVELSLKDGDVSVVTYPANPATSVSLRHLELIAGLAGLDAADAIAELRSAGGEPPLELLRRAQAALVGLVAALTPPAVVEASLAGFSLRTAQAIAEALRLHRAA